MSKIIPLGMQSKIYLAAFILYVIGFYLYFFITKFEKTITVSEEFLIGSNKTIINIVTDKQNKAYQLKDVLLLWSFNTDRNMITLRPGETYRVKGYGIRVGFLSLYPTITSISAPLP
jgi:hypothetical protein